MAATRRKAGAAGKDPAAGRAAAGGVRDRILEAALAILRESGIQRFTQLQIAERAGVRQSHLTYCFPTREDLLEAVTARGIEGIAAGARQAVGDQAGSGDGALLARLAASVADLEHMRMFVAMIVEADGDPTVRELMLDATRRVEGAVADALGGDDAAERARLVLAAVWGLGLYRFLVRPSPKADPTRPYLAWVAAAAEGAGTSGRRKPAR